MPYNPMSDMLYGNYRTRSFTDIWGDLNLFLDDVKESQMGINNVMDETSLSLLYYMLYARYGNSHIASSDENQFKYKVYTTIYMYGPTWKKRLELQKEIRALNLSDIQDGALVIHNHAYNPSSAPSTQTKIELDTINEQNTSRFKKSISDSYMLLTSLLETDVTAYFLDRFKNLFLTIVEPEYPLWYVTELKEFNIEGDEDDA